MPVKIQLRRDLSSNWSSRNPILALGEPGFETDTNKLKLGDGATSWNDLAYLTPDFINIVSSGGIADLTVPQQNDIVEGTIVLTSDGVRWIYTGSGSKTLEASYVQLADISPAWIQITSKPASLVGLADILTTASGDFIIASGNNVYQVVNFAESVDDRIGNGLFVAGTGINLNYNDAGNSFTVSVTGLINNPTNNRILTSRDTTTTGINAESNLTFDGNTLSIPTSGSISSQYIYTNNLRQIGDDASLSIEYGYGISITSLDPDSSINLDVGSTTALINSNGLTINSDVTANYFYGELDGSIILPCKNNTVSTINIGTPVYISGHFANGKVYVEPADASNSAKMPAVGLLGSTLTSGSEGHVHVFGSLTLDTTGLGYVDPTDVGKTLYVASGGGLTLTRPTGETVLVQNIARLARIHNNGKYIILGPGRSNDVPNSISAYKLDIDNIRIDGNTLSSTNSNGNILLSPNGNGYLQNLTNNIIHRVQRSTNDNNSTTLTIDGASPGASNRLIIPAQTTWTFVASISAYNSTDSIGAGWIFRGTLRRDNSNNTVLVGSIIEENWKESGMSDTSVTVTADNTNEALQIDVVGLSSKNIKWVGVVNISQITYV